MGGLGSDSLIGGAGIDTVVYTSSWSGVSVNLSSGTGTGGEADGDVLIGVENVSGSGYDDTLTGDAGANVLAGNSGNDLLEGRAGADTLDGGSGTDTATYAASAAAIVVDLSTGQGVGGDADGDVLSSIENVVGSAFADRITGEASSNLLFGGVGDDTLDGGAGNDTLDGGAGADQLIGGAGIDTATYASSALGIAVDLTARVGSGGDAQGDFFTDVENLIGSAQSDAMTGDAAANVFMGGTGDDTLDGAAGNDGLWGEAGNDTLIGGQGDDTLDGGAGSDTLAGGLGNDLFFVDSAGDLVVEAAGEGRDEVRTTLSSYALTDNVEVLTYKGYGSFAGTGNALANTISGGAGADTLWGEPATIPSRVGSATTSWRVAPERTSSTARRGSTRRTTARAAQLSRLIFRPARAWAGMRKAIRFWRSTT